MLMGVLNTTPDSFSDGGSFATPAHAIERALAMFDEGADIVDIGGESTRPGKHAPLSTKEEVKRVLPVLQGIFRHRPGSILSVDTYHSETAGVALSAGVEIINDVSGFLWDGAMAKVCAAAGCGVVLTHTRGRPEEWSTQPAIDPTQVRQELNSRLNDALRAGLERGQIVLDPGFGFGKIFDQNYALLAGFDQFTSLGQPVLAGLSRKAFLGRTLAPLFAGKPAPVDHRGNASLAAATAAILAGAHLVRVHDVRATREASAIADAILCQGTTSVGP